MLLQQGQTRSLALDRRLAMVLAAVAGAVNTVAFHAVGFFSANMTGNVSTFSDRLASGQWAAGGFYLSIVLAFVLGSALAAQGIHAGRRRQLSGVYALGILAEAVLMALLAAVEVFGWLPGRGASLVLGLSLLMGLQNAVVTCISDGRVRTTHVSGMATDIGIELALWYQRLRGQALPAGAEAGRQRLGLHVQTVLAFLAGGALGVVLYRYIGMHVLWLAAGVLLWLALAALWRRHAAV